MEASGLGMPIIAQKIVVQALRGYVDQEITGRISLHGQFYGSGFADLQFPLTVLRKDDNRN